MVQKIKENIQDSTHLLQQIFTHKNKTLGLKWSHPIPATVEDLSAYAHTSRVDQEEYMIRWMSSIGCLSMLSDCGIMDLVHKFNMASLSFLVLALM